MAIARVTSASNTTTGSATITTSYTIAAGSNRLLIGGGELQTGAPFTAFSYNGSAGTIDISKTDTGGSNTACVASKVGPDVGTFNSVLTKTGSADGLYIGLMDYTGVKQTAQPDATASANTASGTSLSYSITTVADNCWIMTCAGGTQASLDGSTNFTVQQTPAPGIKVGDSNASVGAAGSKTVAMNMSSGRIWSASASYAPAITANGNMLMFM
jgi:hypothetical protein